MSRRADGAGDLRQHLFAVAGEFAQFVQIVIYAGGNHAAQVDAMSPEQRERDDHIRQAQDRITQNRRRLQAHSCQQHVKQQDSKQVDNGDRKKELRDIMDITDAGCGRLHSAMDRPCTSKRSDERT